jgi:hypothetical protein
MVVAPYHVEEQLSPMEVRGHVIGIFLAQETVIIGHIPVIAVLGAAHSLATQPIPVVICFPVPQAVDIRVAVEKTVTAGVLAVCHTAKTMDCLTVPPE